ncbi:hypothetical protein HanRHA438_Chr10g0443351 [Helianthus annuus]|nr:hypothetical protein HanPI659440_Chr03g0098251 [Helianthus annuus]KAJ0878754.1 hypothetical protein HanRHA438_Chr10g0443351 [Helianthus annuus]
MMACIVSTSSNMFPLSCKTYANTANNHVTVLTFWVKECLYCVGIYFKRYNTLH